MFGTQTFDSVDSLRRHLQAFSHLVLMEIPGVGNGNPLQCSCLEKPHGQRSLVGYSSWGRKELDTAEQLNNDNNKVL